jgi:glutathione S-transferase
VKLYGIPPTRALRPIWLLNELGLQCEILPVDLFAGEHRGAEFRAVIPFGKVPVLVDDDLRIAESAAISLYLAERYGGGRFIPSDVRKRAEMYQWIFFLVTEIEQPLWRDALHSMIYPKEERRPEEIVLARRDCREMLEPLEAHMSGREWFVGSEPSVADFIGAFTLDWADEQDLLDDRPALKAFVQRMYARETAPPTIKEGFASLNAGNIPGRWRRSA